MRVAPVLTRSPVAPETRRAEISLDEAARAVEAPVRHAFKAMGTRVQLIAAPGSDTDDVAGAAVTAMRIFAREEQRFSRFMDHSELSGLNARSGSWVRVSGPFAEVTRMSLDAARETGGLFDPTVLPVMRAVGYDRDYGELERERAERPAPVDPDIVEIRRDLKALMIKSQSTCGRWQEIELKGDRIRMPHGVELDFGGIAKGWTVDRAAESVMNLRWAIVDAGGDIRVVGNTPRGGLDIAIEDPTGPGEEALRVRLEDGALATSSVTVRSWGPGLHQIIDPRTSLPAMTGVTQATVWGDTCAQAEVWAKAAVLAGPGILDRVPGALVLETGEVVTNFGDAGLTQPQPEGNTALRTAGARR